MNRDAYLAAANRVLDLVKIQFMGKRNISIKVNAPQPEEEDVTAVLVIEVGYFPEVN